MNTTVKTFSYKDIIDIPYANKILSTEACEFLLELHNEFDGRRKELLNHRVLKQKEYDQGQLPDFDPSTLQGRKGK